MVAVSSRPASSIAILTTVLLSLSSCVTGVRGAGSSLESETVDFSVSGANAKYYNAEDESGFQNPFLKSAFDGQVAISTDDNANTKEQHEITQYDAPATPVHSEGTCALYSSCGKQSLFGPELPCPANVKATDPDADTRKALVEVCGEDNWSDGPICCDIGQVSTPNFAFIIPNPTF